MIHQQVRVHSRRFDSGIATNPGPCVRGARGEEIVQRLRVKALPLRQQHEALRIARGSSATVRCQPVQSRSARSKQWACRPSKRGRSGGAATVLTWLADSASAPRSNPQPDIRACGTLALCGT
jgi:hypothetical protein